MLRLRLAQARDLIRHGDMRVVLRRAGRLLWSDVIAIGVRLDLAGQAGTSEEPASGRIRPASAEDVEAVLDPARGDPEGGDEAWQRRLRRYVLERLGADGCYVIDSEGRGPSFMQYVFYESDNERIQASLPGTTPLITSGEGLLEYLYVAPDVRSMPFLVGCMREVAAEARRAGTGSVFTFLRPDDAVMLVACQMTGFTVDAVRRTRSRLFRRSVVYGPRPLEMPASPSELITRR